MREQVHCILGQRSRESALAILDPFFVVLQSVRYQREVVVEFSGEDFLVALADNEIAQIASSLEKESLAFLGRVLISEVLLIS